MNPLNASPNVDVTINIHALYGSALFVHKSTIDNLVNDIQHVRRRETIAMTPVNALKVLNEIVNSEPSLSHQDYSPENQQEDKQIVIDCIKENTGSQLTPLIASSGLSIQYAMMMGLVENAIKQFPNKAIKILLPPNCYGGTNDQSRRIADLIPNVGIVDLLVDGGEDLVSSLDVALKTVADSDGFIGELLNGVFY